MLEKYTAQAVRTQHYNVHDSNGFDIFLNPGTSSSTISSICLISAFMGRNPCRS